MRFGFVTQSGIIQPFVEILLPFSLSLRLGLFFFWNLLVSLNCWTRCIGNVLVVHWDTLHCETAFVVLESISSRKCLDSLSLHIHRCFKFELAHLSAIRHVLFDRPLIVYGCLETVEVSSCGRLYHHILLVCLWWSMIGIRLWVHSSILVRWVWVSIRRCSETCHWFF